MCSGWIFIWRGFLTSGGGCALVPSSWCMIAGIQRRPFGKHCHASWSQATALPEYQDMVVHTEFKFWFLKSTWMVLILPVVFMKSYISYILNAQYMYMSRSLHGAVSIPSCWVYFSFVLLWVIQLVIFCRCLWWLGCISSVVSGL